jgi:ComEC/Rec2-related protein
MGHSLVTIALVFVLGLALGQRLFLAPTLLAGFLVAFATTGAILRRALGTERMAPDRMSCEEGTVSEPRAWSREQGLMRATFLLAVLTAGALRVQLASPLMQPTHYLTQSAFGAGRFQVLVTDDPIPAGGVWRAQAELQGVRGGERLIPLSGQMRLVFHPVAGSPRPAYGDLLELSGTLSAPQDTYSGPATTLKDLWAAEGVHGVLRPSGPMTLVRRTGGNPVWAAMYALRWRVSDMLDQTHPPEVASFVRLILLGMRDVPSDRVDDYRTTGTYHLLSISGCHVGILALVLASLMSALLVPRRPAALMTLGVLSGYAVLSGGSPGVLRASLMAAIVIVGQVAQRPAFIYTSLAASALALLVHDPMSLFLPGFQLSFVAVLAIAYLTPPLMTRLDFLPPYLNALLSTSLAASLGTAPVLAHAFGMLPLVSPLANLLAIPIFGIILPTALLGVAGSLLSPWIPFFFGAANYGFVTLLNWLVGALAALPGAAVDVTRVPPVAWTLFGLALVVLGDWHNLKQTVLRALKIGDSAARAPADDEFDQERLARTARELVCLVPEERDVTDPLSQKLAQVRGTIRVQTQELAPEFLLRCEALNAEPWTAPLDPLTLAYLGLAESYFLTARSPDKAPALLLLLKALEHELNAHLFGLLRLSPGHGRAAALSGRYANHPTVAYLASPPRHLSLAEQNEVLWSMITTQERPLKGLVRSIRRGLASTLADPTYFLDPSQFPLRLDQIYKRFYLRLDKEDWNWEAVRRAREDILGPKQENLFEQIGRALGIDMARSNRATAVPIPALVQAVATATTAAAAPAVGRGSPDAAAAGGGHAGAPVTSSS